MKKVITYGTYDLLHTGHIALLKRAKELGDYLIVGVTSDSFDKSRGKLNVKQSLVDRIESVRETGIADEIIVEEYEGQKISDIQKYKIDIFTVGSDWVGKFDYLESYCKVVYLPRTVGVSSTDIRKSLHKVIKMGIIGSGYDMQRFCDEARGIGGLQIIGSYNPYDESDVKFEEKSTQNSSLDRLLDKCDAVYINTVTEEHYIYIMKSIENGCHVICMGPMFLSKKEANTAHQYAKDRGVVLFEAVKTLYFPAFEHLLLLIGSGVIGKVKDVEVACSQVPIDFSHNETRQ
ncbi:MAG: adenylyltransferase/cytidyltransferase family protein, partial [Ruminococcus flavefaciens]|nr:adenylyltransferase/cytidyltransferase family protein [Ruminococcus flavefaciens]